MEHCCQAAAFGCIFSPPFFMIIIPGRGRNEGVRPKDLISHLALKQGQSKLSMALSPFQPVLSCFAAPATIHVVQFLYLRKSLLMTASPKAVAVGLIWMEVNVKWISPTVAPRGAGLCPVLVLELHHGLRWGSFCMEISLPSSHAVNTTWNYSVCCLI